MEARINQSLLDSLTKRRLPAVEKRDYGLSNYGELYIKLATDPQWRLTHLYKIKEEDSAIGKLVYLNLRPAQEQFIQNIWPKMCVVKARQHGITTLGLLIALDKCLTLPNIECGITAHRTADANKFKERIKLAWTHISPIVLEILGVKKRLVRDAGAVIKFSNGSAIYCSTSFRSTTLEYLHISELAKISVENRKLATEIKTGSMEAVKAGGMVVYESTTEGPSGLFYDTAMEAQESMRLHANKIKSLTADDFKILFLPWYMKDLNRLSTRDAIKEKLPHKIKMYLRGVEAETGKCFSLEQKAWYAKKEGKLTDKMRYEHPSTLKEAFTPASTGMVLGNLMRQMAAKKFIGSFPHNKRSPVYTFSDLGVDGVCILIVQEGPDGTAWVINHITGKDQGLTYYRDELKKMQDEHKYMFMSHWAGHDITQRQFFHDAKTAMQVASETMGILFQPCARYTNKEMPIQLGIEFLRGDWVRFDQEAVQPVIDALSSVRWRISPQGIQSTQVVHDEKSHTFDAFLHLATTWQDRLSTVVRRRDYGLAHASEQSRRMASIVRKREKSSCAFNDENDLYRM